MIKRTQLSSDLLLDESIDSDILDLRASTSRLAQTPDFVPSDEQIAQVGEYVMSKPLSPDFSRWVSEYETVGDRDGFLWNWCRQAVEMTTLPCVSPEHHDELCDTKTLGVMLDVLLDDIADQNGDIEFLEELLLIPDGQIAPEFNQFSADKQAYGRFAEKVWTEITDRSRRYPCFGEYQDLLRFDYLQLCNVMRYSHLLNATPQLLNLVEHDLYTPHNMHIMICATFDLMCSPDFDRTELGKLREITWNAQWMGRIGNLATTWQRELGESDFTSGVYARAVTDGDVTVEQLYTNEPEKIQQIIEQCGHEEYFLSRWQEHRRFLLSAQAHLHSFDVGELVAGLERLICLHLGSRGRK